MKKKNQLILFLLLLHFFTGCERNSNFEPTTPFKNNFTVEQAQIWYGNETVSLVALKSGSIISQTIGIRPDWCNSLESHNDQEDLVEVGILTQGSFGFADENSAKEWNAKQDPVSIGSLTRMIFLKNKSDGRIISFLMTIVGDNTYHQNKESKIGKNSYFSKEKHFSGYVLYHNLNGNFVNGWKYEKGIVVAKTNLKAGGSVPTQLKVQTICNNAVIYIWMQDCLYWSQTTLPLTGTSYYSQCGTPYLTGIPAENCSDGGIVYDPFGIPVPNNAAGGYSLNPTAAPEPKKYTAITNNISLDKAQTDLLETALSEIINQSCISGKPYYLLTQGNHKINFTMLSSSQYPGLYDPSTKTITFKNNSTITCNSLKEELFHAAQDFYYQGGTDQYSNVGFSNIEFEAKLYKDITEWACCSMFVNPDVPSEISNEYISMVQGFAQQGYTSFTPASYVMWVDRFRTYNPAPYNRPQSTVFTNTNFLNSFMSSCLN